MVNRAAELPQEKFPSFRVIFIDEAQDLSAKQWQIVHKLKTNCDKIYVAGDDDQCIFSFNGSEVKEFLKLQEEFHQTVLDKSWRVPISIWEEAQKVIQRNPNRYCKEVSPKQEVGFWAKITENQIPNVVNRVAQDNSVLVLARTNTLVRNLRNKFEKDFPLKKNVRFLTLHECKGKEADIVFLDTALSKWTRRLMDIEEETRLFYVGMTRAKKELYLIVRENGFKI
jgi:superfamily I DNA/RNA helicase